MAKKIILITGYSIASLPFLFLSLLLKYFNIWNLKSDITKCLFTIDKYKCKVLGDNLPYVLIIAEDKRNKFHHGVDHIALVRALYVGLFKGCVQGASTIEQQFVRVVTNRYERKLSRKLREQILATAVLARSSKNGIAHAYLSIAFYGSGLYGYNGLKKICREPLSNVSIKYAIGAVSRLKYPEPSFKTSTWKTKIYFREQYINAEIKKTGNKALQGTSGQRHSRQAKANTVTYQQVAHHVGARPCGRLSAETSIDA